MRNVRLVHFYLGVFFAPLIIFFAFTGTLQVFKLHETCRDTRECQADWVAWFGGFHKEQAWIVPKPRNAPAASPAKKERRPPEANPMSWLVALMGVTLMATTLLGLYIGFNYPNRRKGFLLALGAGVVIPLVLMAF